jgi:DNA repair protein RadB
MELELLPSGTDLFDELLEGGYEKDVITTIYGPSGSGKTTVCLLAAISTIKQGKKVVIIDTEGGFSPTRFMQLTNKDKTYFEHVFILKPVTFQEQIKTINKLKDLISKNIGLIIVDTISYLYRIEMGKGEIKQINNKLGLQVSYLTEIARKHNIPILITNQVYADFDEKDAVKMVGGDILKYGSKCLLELLKFKTKRAAVLKKHRSIKEGKKVVFEITSNGFEEEKEKFSE